MRAEQRGGRVVLDLPLNNPQPVAHGRFSSLSRIASCGLPVKSMSLCSTTRKLLIRLEDDVSQADLENISPDTVAMQRSETSGEVKGVILTTTAGGQYDFVSRYFAPWNGIPEDPVTGNVYVNFFELDPF